MPCEFKLLSLSRAIGEKLGFKQLLLSYAQNQFISSEILPTHRSNISYSNTTDVKTLFYAEFDNIISLPYTQGIEKGLDYRLSYNLSCATIQELKRKS